MSSTVENKVESNTPQQKTETPQQKVDTTNQKPPASPTLAAVEPEVKEDENFKAFREGRKKDRLDREAAEKRAAEKEAEAQALKAAMEAILNKGPQTQQSGNSGYMEEETEDQRIEKKVQAALAQREAEFEKQRVQREQQEYPQRLQQIYPDFNQTISAENLDYLEYHYPEVAAPLKRLPDGFDRWSDIYKAIKKFVPNTNAKKDIAKADANYNKPKSISSTGMTQAGDSQGNARLTEERKAANWERMQRQLKGLN